MVMPPPPAPADDGSFSVKLLPIPASLYKKILTVDTDNGCSALPRLKTASDRVIVPSYYSVLFLEEAKPGYPPTPPQQAICHRANALPESRLVTVAHPVISLVPRYLA